MEMKNYILMKFDGRGRLKECLEGKLPSMLKLWALQNTKGKALTIIKEEDTEKIIAICKGVGNDFPKMITNVDEIAAMGIVIEEV